MSRVTDNQQRAAEVVRGLPGDVPVARLQRDIARAITAAEARGRAEGKNNAAVDAAQQIGYLQGHRDGRAELAAKVRELADEWLTDGCGQAARDRNGISDEAWLKLVAATRLRALIAEEAS